MNTLIDKALKVCGSNKELARQLGVAPSVVSMLKKERTISPDTAAMLAAMAGEDAREAAIQAMIENAKGTRREGVLREILGKGLALGVAGLLAFSYSKDSISGEISAEFVKKEVNNLYIVECLNNRLKTLRGFLKRLISPQAGPLSAG